MTEETLAYYTKHRAKLLEMKESAIKSVNGQRAIRKMLYQCQCGAVVGCKQLDYHFVSQKHRKVCGDLPTTTNSA